MGADFWFWKNHIFMFYFFLKVDPTILSSKRLILIKILITTNGTDFLSGRNLSKLIPLIRGNRYYVLLKQVVCKTLFKLT